MQRHHRLPAASPEPSPAPAGSDIRFPSRTEGHSIRARKQEDT